MDDRTGLAQSFGGCDNGPMSFFVASFGELPVRFVLRSGDLFVSKDDLFAAITSCFTPRIQALGGQFIEHGLSLLSDSQDKRAAVMGDSEIGPAVHFHAAGSLLHSLSDLTNVDSDDLRESSFRVSTLLRWYSAATARADEHFGRTVVDLLGSVKKRLDRLNPPLTVEVTFSDGYYTAECDALNLVTEAKTLDELTERTWLLVPDLIELNDLPMDADSVRLRFDLVQSAQQRIAL